MKVLLFSHKSDIDGLGAVVLAKIAFRDLDYELCEVYELDDVINNYIDNNKIKEYDKVFITDLCLNQSMVNKINADNNLYSKITIYDHHPRDVKKFDYNYDWINIIVENDQGKCSGTSLFFEHLISEGYLTKTKALDVFVEWTRQYDTWEWKNKYNNVYPKYLNILMIIYQAEMYINEMINKLLSNSDNFLFSDSELKLIALEEKKVSLYVDKAIANMNIYNIGIDKVGVVFAEGYRNDIAEFLRNQKFDIDYVAIINLYRKTISYRSIKEGFNVKNIALKYGGDGHIEASSNYITNEYRDRIIKLLFNLD